MIRCGMECCKELKDHLQMGSVKALCLVHDFETFRSQIVHNNNTSFLTGKIAAWRGSAMSFRILEGGIKGRLELGVEVRFCAEEQGLGNS